MKKLIVNADDYGYSYGINRGIVEAHTKGVVTSTSLMVDAVAAEEAAGLNGYPELSVGLHLVLHDSLRIEAELEDQVGKFKKIMGKMPDHIDVHKVLNRSEELRTALRAYSEKNKTPVRQLGFAKFIGSYFGPHANGDVSVSQFKKAIDQATDEYNEIMCHAGYSDDYLREHSSYNDMRELELKTLCDPALRDYAKEKGLQLVSWRSIR